MDECIGLIVNHKIYGLSNSEFDHFILTISTSNGNIGIKFDKVWTLDLSQFKGMTILSREAFNGKE